LRLPFWKLVRLNMIFLSFTRTDWLGQRYSSGAGLPSAAPRSWRPARPVIGLDEESGSCPESNMRVFLLLDSGCRHVLRAVQPAIQIAAPEKVTFAVPDAGHASFPGHLLDGFQVAPQMNRGFFRCQERLKVLLISRFNQLLLHIYCLQNSTVLIYSHEPKRTVSDAEKYSVGTVT